uniref:Uncharacterized protein n=1 Tax=Timema poppense TaxID=170557 RepID=A0A7R9HGU8_TIMPO|nr:unnamed protein product [Timema poppensis]
MPLLDMAEKEEDLSYEWAKDMACYMLGLFDSHTSANYLITLVFDKSEERLGPGVRLRALQCLVAAIEEDLLQKLTCRSIANITYSCCFSNVLDLSTARAIHI